METKSVICMQTNYIRIVCNGIECPYSSIALLIIREINWWCIIVISGTYVPPPITTRDPNAPSLPPTAYPPGQFCKDKPDGKYPHETDCTRFYECHQNGQTVERQCASGLVFNPDSGGCVWPTDCPNCNC